MLLCGKINNWIIFGPFLLGFEDSKIKHYYFQLLRHEFQQKKKKGKIFSFSLNSFTNSQSLYI